MEIIIYIAVFFLIITSIYTIRYFRIKKVINSPIRSGYYDLPMKYGKEEDIGHLKFTPRIYIKELDRYTNGFSKIKISKIEYMISKDKIEHLKIDKYIRDNFSEIKETNEIIWLDSENEIKQLRKQKLDKINKRKFFF